jgi:3-oxoadipate enol-lactonase
MASASFASKFFTTTKGTKTHYLQTGDKNGTLLICLHGLGGSVNTFTSLVKYLPEKYNIVLVDFQGFGKTPLRSKTEPIIFGDYVPDLHDLVTFLQADSGSVEGSKVCTET